MYSGCPCNSSMWERTFGKKEKMEKEIKELEEIRERITKIYMDLGNPDYVEADSVLNQDISKLKDK